MQGLWTYGPTLAATIFPKKQQAAAEQQQGMDAPAGTVKQKDT